MAATTKILLVPVATIGCGKTTTAQTLVNVAPHVFGSVANDDMPSGASGRRRFFRTGLNELVEHNVVILDKNNHQYRERTMVFDELAKHRADFLSDDVRLKVICLSFVKGNPREPTLWKTTTTRVIERGDNHQSIKANKDGPGVVYRIMGGFAKRFEPIDKMKKPDNLFDLVIQLEVEGDSSLRNARKILKVLSERFPEVVSMYPSDEEWKQAFTKALNYTPDHTKLIRKRAGAQTTSRKEKNVSQN